MAAKWIWRSIGIVGFALSLSACHQNGTVLRTTVSDDTVDVNPGDGLCADVNGDCSLRAAVMEANALPGVEEIRVESGHQLSLPEGQVDTDAGGDLDITEALVIRGQGTIWSDAVPRLLDIRVPSGLVEIEGVAFQGGDEAIRISGGGLTLMRNLEIGGFAGPAVVLDGSFLIAEGVTFRSNGGREVILGRSGRAKFENATFTRNHIEAGVVNVLDADVTLVHVTIAENEVATDGDVAGLRLDPSGSGSVMVQSSIVQAAGSLGDGIACAGNIVGIGHNYSDDATCGFSGPTDIIVEYPTLAMELTSERPAVFELHPLAVVVDAAAAGGCTRGNLDAVSNPRPDGIACDIGAIELQRGDCLDPGPGDDLRYCDFRGRDFSGWDLRDVDLSFSYLSDADFTDAVLTGALVVPEDIDGANFTRASLEGATLGANGRVVLDHADLTDAIVKYVSIVSAVGVDLSGASVSSILLQYPGASLADAVVEGTSFQWVDLGGVSSGGVSGEPAVLPEGFVIVDGYFVGRGADLRNAALAGSDLSSATMYELDASGADFTDATFGSAAFASNFTGALFDRADASGSNLASSSFGGVSAISTDFSGANLRSTDWDAAWVIGVDFTGADLFRARFTDAVLLLNTWDDTICPSGVNSDDNGGNCDGQFTYGAPSVGGGAAVPAQFQGMGVEDFAAGGLVDD